MLHLQHLTLRFVDGLVRIAALLPQHQRSMGCINSPGGSIGYAVAPRRRPMLHLLYRTLRIDLLIC